MFFTFYSFRGGQGQSLALTNAAVNLAMKGLRVLLIDMAFQGPCLPRLIGLPQGRERGLIDMIEEHLQGVEDDTPLAKRVLWVPRSREMTGEIMVLPAGGRRGGAARRAPDVPWEAFYREHEGYLFFENLRGDIQANLRPDLVLIDGGSGPNDPAGIAVLQLADALLLFSGASNLSMDSLVQGSEHIPSTGPSIRGPRERMVIVSPMPASSEESVERCLKTASRLGGALQAMPVPYSSTQAWTADGRLVLARPGEPVCQSYRSISAWLDGSGLDANGFRIRVESQAHNPSTIVQLLQRIHAPQAAVLEAFREALIEESELCEDRTPLAETVAKAQVPFLWRVTAAEALLDAQRRNCDSREHQPLQETLAVHQARYLPRARLSREFEARLLTSLADQVSGVLGGKVLIEAVRSLMHRGGEVPVVAALGVLKKAVSEGSPSLFAAAVKLASRLPKRNHEAVVVWLRQLDIDKGADIEALIDAYAAVGQGSPTWAARALANLWAGSEVGGFPHRPALVALRKMLEHSPGELAPLLIEEGTSLLARDFEHGWKDQERSAVWYVVAPAHQGSALIGLVEDALSHWLVLGDRRANAVIERLQSSTHGVARWVLLGALPMAPERQRRRLISAVQDGFLYPPPGSERRWDAAGVAWSDGKGPTAPSADPVALGLVEDMARTGLRPPSEARAQRLLQTLALHPELPKGLVLATSHHALSAREQLPIRARQSAEALIFAALPQRVAVEAMIDLVRHRGTTPALLQALQQLISEREAGAGAVANGLTSLAETQFDLAITLAEKILDVGPTVDAWAGLLDLAGGPAHKRIQLMERVLNKLAASDLREAGLFSPATKRALSTVILATIVSGRRVAIGASVGILMSPTLPQAARRSLLRDLAGRFGAGLEGRRAERVFGQLLEHPEPAARSAAALAAAERVLELNPGGGLAQELLTKMAGEIGRDRPSVDVIYAFLMYLAEWSGDLDGSSVALVAKVMIPTSPAVAEPRLVRLALDVLARILRAGRVEPKYLEAAQSLRESLRQGGVAKQA